MSTPFFEFFSPCQPNGRQRRDGKQLVTYLRGARSRVEGGNAKAPLCVFIWTIVL